MYLIRKLIDPRIRMDKSPRKRIHTPRMSGIDSFGGTPTVISKYYNNNNNI